MRGATPTHVILDELLNNKWDEVIQREELDKRRDYYMETSRGCGGPGGTTTPCGGCMDCLGGAEEMHRLMLESRIEEAGHSIRHSPFRRLRLQRPLSD